MDPMTFASLAQIRILLLPVGSIKRPSFEKWASEIRSFENIRLGDIPADPQEDKGASSMTVLMFTGSKSAIPKHDSCLTPWHPVIYT